MPNFTVKMLDNIPNSEPGKRVTYHDDMVKGLSIRITGKGIKSFIVRKRINGKLALNTLGRYPAMTIEQARKSARQTLNSYSAGINPNNEQRDSNIKSITLGQTMDDYIHGRNAQLKPKTVSDYNILFNGFLSEWKSKELKSTSDHNNPAASDCLKPLNKMKTR